MTEFTRADALMIEFTRGGAMMIELTRAGALMTEFTRPGALMIEFTRADALLFIQLVYQSNASDDFIEQLGLSYCSCESPLRLYYQSKWSEFLKLVT